MQYQFDGERERRAEFAMPKRTKQMGGIEQRLRIFVEDYVTILESKHLWHATTSAITM